MNTMVYDAFTNTDIDVWAPNYDVAEQYEAFVSETYAKIMKYRSDNNIVLRK